jgi:hypothetical protein
MSSRPEDNNPEAPVHGISSYGAWLRGRLAVFAVALLPLLGGCTHVSSAVAPGGDPMVVTEDQIATLHANNAYEIVAKTHGNFLHSRGRESDDPRIPAIPVHVFVDNTYYGDLSTLLGIGTEVVAEIRLYQSYEAQYKFGSGHMGGVIQVITKM